MKQTADLLRNQASGLDRIVDHVMKPSATPGQIAQALRATATEIRRAANTVEAEAHVHDALRGALAAKLFRIAEDLAR